jgi:hypothetical protein
MGTQLKFELYEEELLNPLRGHKLTAMENYVASLLLTASSHRPIGIAQIIQSVKGSTELRFKGKTLKSKERAVKDIIRTLRKDHTFPILASRKKPTGYWWCASIAEMEAFIESYRAQALDELHTLSKIVKHNYPALQGQLKFEEM